MSLNLQQFGIDRLDPGERLELIGLIWDSIGAGDASGQMPDWRRGVGETNSVRRCESGELDSLGDGQSQIVQAMMKTNLPVAISVEAEVDLRVATDWYEREGELGQMFIAAVSNAIGRIAATPEMFGIAGLNVRECRLHRFPYVIYFRISTDRIEVLAILHAKRNPTLWRARARPDHS